MENQDRHIIYAFPRGKGEEIQIALSKHKDNYYIDLRHWFQSKNENSFLPTKRGVNFSIESIQELRRGIERLSKAIERIKSDTELLEI